MNKQEILAEVNALPDDFQGEVDITETKHINTKGKFVIPTGILMSSDDMLDFEPLTCND